MTFKANSTLFKLLTHEHLFIVWSRTKNYKTYTKSSVLHFLMTLESRKVLNLEGLSPWLVDHKILRGLLSYFIWDLKVKT